MYQFPIELRHRNYWRGEKADLEVMAEEIAMVLCFSGFYPNIEISK
jgi:hypothetical protein